VHSRLSELTELTGRFLTRSTLSQLVQIPVNPYNGDMILLLNGSFGVGKTTVARLLKKRMPGSLVYNPEWAGSVLMRLPSFFKLKGARTDDFQDIALWRKSVVRGTRLFRALARETVIVPMAFSRRDYFDEILKGINQSGDRVKVYCLKAELPTILKRLAQRGERTEAADWVVRRARECLEAHRDEHFGETVDTENLTGAEVAEEILSRLADLKNSEKSAVNSAVR
jgi:chloramphenicol 3-O-phosphotransferase